MSELFSQRIQSVLASVQHIYQFAFESKAARQLGNPDSSNFAFGNPHEMVFQSFVDALQKASVPQNKDWYAYPDEIRSAKEVVTATLREKHALPFKLRSIPLVRHPIHIFTFRYKLFDGFYICFFNT